MKLVSLVKRVVAICCTLFVLFGFQIGFQAISLTGNAAIASPLKSEVVSDSLIADKLVNPPNDRAAINKVKEDVKSAFDSTIGSGAANRIEGKAEGNYGKLQRDLSNNKAQGAANQVRGGIKQATGKAQSAVEDATESVQDAASGAIDAVKDLFNK